MRISRSTSRDERGASAVEYALIAALVAAVIVGTVTVFGTVVAGLFDVEWPL